MQNEVLKDNARIKVQLPERKEADASGCNWHAAITGDLSGHEAVIARVVSEVEGLYNLQ